MTIEIWTEPKCLRAEIMYFCSDFSLFLFISPASPFVISQSKAWSLRISSDCAMSQKKKRKEMKKTSLIPSHRTRRLMCSLNWHFFHSSLESLEINVYEFFLENAWFCFHISNSGWLSHGKYKIHAKNTQTHTSIEQNTWKFSIFGRLTMPWRRDNAGGANIKCIYSTPLLYYH